MTLNQAYLVSQYSPYLECCGCIKSTSQENSSAEKGRKKLVNSDPPFSLPTSLLFPSSGASAALPLQRIRRRRGCSDDALSHLLSCVAFISGESRLTD